MRRSPRFVVASCAAAVIGVGTAFTVATDLTALHDRARALGPVEEVMIATREVPLGVTIEPADLAAVDRHRSTVPDDALHSPGAAVGHTVVVPLVPGAVVQAAHLAPADRDGVAGIVPPGRRAVRITPADGARPEPGTVVDVLAALDPSLVGATNRAIAVARGARVLAVDELGGAAGEYAANGASGVTLLVTEDEAYDLAFAAANGVLSLAVAPPEAACCTSPEP